MTLNRSLFFLIAAIVCFVIALLLVLSVFSGGNMVAWELGGLLSLALSFVP
jgi:hypothetical protein